MRSFQFLVCATLAVIVQGAKLGNHHASAYGVQQPSQLYGPPQETAKPALAEPQHPKPVVEESIISLSEPKINQDDWNREKSYSFGYSSQDGKREETSDDHGNVKGSYFQIGADGEPFEVFYRAGADIGFVIDNIDEVRRRASPRQITTDIESDSEAVGVAEASDAEVNQPEDLIENAPEAPVQESQANDEPIMNEQSEDLPFDPMDYSFHYVYSQNSHKEMADSFGNVRGEYSYPIVGGPVVNVKYRVNPYSGFVIENEDELKKALEESNKAIAEQDHSDQSPEAYQAPAPVQPVSYVQPQQVSQVVPVVQTNPQQLPYTYVNEPDQDFMPYDFEYGYSLGSHKESADDSGNVRGEYSYPLAHGKNIVVQYKVNPESGFVIENEDELKKALEDSNKAIAEQDQQDQSPEAYQAPAPVQPVSYVQPQQVSQVVPVVQTNPQQLPHTYVNQPDQDFMPYDFEYGYSLGSHKESADDSGNVRGEYSYSLANGQNIQVQYKVNPESGFVIENDEELKKALEDSNKAIAEQYQQQDQTHGAKTKPAPVQPISNFQEQAVPVVAAYQQQVGNTINQQPQSQTQEEKYSAYQFGFSHDFGSRQESADASGNVQGKYSYTDANGANVEVQYKAGPKIGFVIENEEGIESSAAKAQNGFAYQSQVNAAGQQALPYPELPQQPSSIGQAQPQHPAQKIEEQKIEYSPYSFNYQGDESGRFEEADASGVVRGRYNYINAEGNTIVVEYSASPETGFVIENEQELTQSLEKATKDGAQAAAAARTEQHRKQAEQNQEVQQGLSAFNKFAKDRQQSQLASQDQSGAFSYQTQVGQVQENTPQRPHQPQAHTYAQASAPISAPTLSIDSLPNEEPTLRRIVIRKRRPQSQTGNAHAYAAQPESVQTKSTQDSEQGAYEYITPEGIAVSVSSKAGKGIVPRLD